MKLRAITYVLGLSAFTYLLVGCAQEAASSKPSTRVVKKVEKPPEAAAPQRPSPTRVTDRASRKPTETARTAKRTPERVMEERRPVDAKLTASLSEPLRDFVYNPGDRPDPFRPFFIEARSVEVISECEGVPPGPLTEKEATQFDLVAVINRSGESPLAMVQDPEGKGYVLEPGTYVGKRCGKVTWIGPDGVIVEEPYRDLTGQRQTRKISLGFKVSEGGGREKR